MLRKLYSLASEECNAKLKQKLIKVKVSELYNIISGLEICGALVIDDI